MSREERHASAARERGVRAARECGARGALERQMSSLPVARARRSGGTLLRDKCGDSVRLPSTLRLLAFWRWAGRNAEHPGCGGMAGLQVARAHGMEDGGAASWSV